MHSLPAVAGMPTTHACQGMQCTSPCLPEQSDMWAALLDIPTEVLGKSQAQLPLTMPLSRQNTHPLPALEGKMPA